MKHHTSALFTGLWGGNVYKSGQNGEIMRKSQRLALKQEIPFFLQLFVEINGQARMMMLTIV